MNYMESVNIKELNERIQKESAFVDLLSLEMGKVIVGQKHLVENLMIAMLDGDVNLFVREIIESHAYRHLEEREFHLLEFSLVFKHLMSLGLGLTNDNRDTFLNDAGLFASNLL